MKKYFWAVGITAVLSLALVFGGKTAKNRIATVPIQEVYTQKVTQTVLCTGKVEKAGQEVLATSTGAKVQVRAAVPENRLKAVQVGQRVLVTGTAFAAERYSGTVIALGDAAYTTPTGNTVMDVVVALDATDYSLKCGLTAKVTICVSENEGIVVPYSSLFADDKGLECVYVVENNRAVRREVTVGEELADGVVVATGVAEGEVLIVDADAVRGDGTLVQGERI